MKSTLLVFALSVAASLSPVSSANARVYLATFSGKVSNSFDQSGVFGESGRTLDGLDFKVVVTIENPTPDETFGTVQSGLEGIVRLGGNGGVTIPSAVLTIDSHAEVFAFEHSQFDYIIRHSNDNPQFDQIGYFLGFDDFNPGLFSTGYVSFGLKNFAQDLLPTRRIGQELNYMIKGGDLVDGSFGFSHDSGSSGGFENDANGTLNLASFSIASAPVPEPASWALVITGFGLVGSALRRRIAILRIAPG